jgi:zinc and cadmium transporter
MSPWLSSALAIAVISAVPLAVTLLLAYNESPVRRFLPHLSALGAGALLGAASMHLLPEALRAGIGPGWVVAGTLVGYGAFALVERMLATHDHAHAHGLELGAPPVPAPAHQHAHAHDHDPSHGTSSIVPLALAGDAIHNLVDGMLIAAGFLANPTFGFLTAAAIGLHELPREVGSYGIFVRGGIHPLRAVGFNIITALVSFAGAAATLALGRHVADFGNAILPFAAGSYVYIAVAIGRPALRNMQALSDNRGEVIWLMSGLVLMGVSALLMGSH